MRERLLMWLDAHQTLLAAISAVSILLTLVSVLAVPWLIARLPVDFFQHSVERRGWRRQPLVTFTRNLIGASLVLLGLIMFVTPGPGLIVLLLGLSISRFPGKQRMIRKVLASPRLFDSLNWIREQRNQPPFLRPLPQQRV